MAMKTLFLISLCFNRSVLPSLAIYFYFPSAILSESCIIIIIIIILLPPHVGNQPNINLQGKAVAVKDSVKILEYWLSASSRSDASIVENIAKARQAFFAYESIGLIH